MDLSPRVDRPPGVYYGRFVLTPGNPRHFPDSRGSMEWNWERGGVVEFLLT